MKRVLFIGLVFSVNIPGLYASCLPSPCYRTTIQIENCQVSEEYSSRGGLVLSGKHLKDTVVSCDPKRPDRIIEVPVGQKEERQSTNQFYVKFLQSCEKFIRGEKFTAQSSVLCCDTLPYRGLCAFRGILFDAP